MTDLKWRPGSGRKRGLPPARYFDSGIRLTVMLRQQSLPAPISATGGYQVEQPGSGGKVLPPLAFWRDCGQEYLVTWRRDRSGTVSYLAWRDASVADDGGGRAAYSDGYLYVSADLAWRRDVETSTALPPETPGILCVCQAAVDGVVESESAGPGSDFSEELAAGVGPAALDVRAAPECPPGPALVIRRSSAIMIRQM
jgi:hypothetical protein